MLRLWICLFPGSATNGGSISHPGIGKLRCTCRKMVDCGAKESNVLYPFGLSKAKEGQPG
jgi:hypothetical protein